MKDFKSYTPPEQPADGHKAESTVNAGDVNSTVELAKVLSKAMNGKSEGQLLHTIIAEAETRQARRHAFQRRPRQFLQRAFPSSGRFQAQKAERSYYKT